MRVLFLHDLMVAQPLRRQLANQCFLLQKYRPATETVLHAVGDPVDDALRHGDFDAIVLDVSFLCWRWAKPLSVFEAFLREYAWVAAHPAVKLAFPQDDYDHQAVLDEWLSSWRVDVVFSPLAHLAAVLYPKTALTGEIRPFLTGYVDDVDLALAGLQHLLTGSMALHLGRWRVHPQQFEGQAERLAIREAQFEYP